MSILEFHDLAMYMSVLGSGADDLASRARIAMISVRTLANMIDLTIQLWSSWDPGNIRDKRGNYSKLILVIILSV